MSASNLTLRRWQLAAQLKKMRLDAGMTIKEVAGKLMVDPSMISRLENGLRGATARDIKGLSEIYGISDQQLVDRLTALASKSRVQGLRHEFGDLGDAAMYRHMDIEAAASAITEVQISYLPGLLQVEKYASALIRGVLPRIAPDVLERRVQARMKRRERLLEDPPPPYHAFVDEASLRRVIGGARTMHEQLAHMVEMAELHRVTLQVVPFTAGAYIGMDVPFMLYELQEPMPSPIVFLERMDSLEYLEKPESVTIYGEAIDHLREAALPPAASVKLIEEIKQGYRA